MEYRTRIIIGDSVKIYDSPDREGSPYISPPKLKDSTALSNAITLGTSVSKQLTFSLYNAPIEVFDGQKVEFAIKHDEPDSSDIDLTGEELTDEEIMEIFQEEDADTDEQELTVDEAGSITDMLDAEGEEDEYLLSEEEEIDDEVAFEEYDSNEVYREDETGDETDLSSETFEELDEYTPMGEFYITQIQNVEGVYIITALDGFILMNGLYTPQIASGTVAEMHSDFISQLEENLGIVCLEEPDYPDLTISWNINTTYREAAGYFAGLLGGYATFDRSGALDIRQYMKNAELSLSSADIEDYQINSDSSVMIGGMRCDTDISSLHNYLKTDDADSYYCIEFENPFVTQTVLDDIYESYYQHLEYTPARLVMEWDFPVQAGDLIKVDENWILITNQTIDFGSGITTIDSLGSMATLTDGQIEDPMTRKVQRVQTLIAEEIEADRARIGVLESDEAYLQKAVIQDATITNLSVLNSSIGEALANTLTAEKITAVQTAIDNASITNITSDNISAKLATLDTVLANILTASELNAVKAVISQLTVENLAVNNLKARYAQIDGANITTATIRDAWVDKLMVQSGLIAHEGTVYTLDAIQVNASSITAGTIDVDRLIVTVEGEKYLVHINPSTGTPSYQKLDGDVIEDLTITADKIVAGAITAEKITTENIVGSGGWINLRSGTFAYFNANYTSGIAWNGSSLTILADSIDISSAVSVAQDSADDIRRQVNGGSQIYWDVDNNEVLESFDIVTQDTVTDRVKTPYTDSEGNQYYQDAEGNISTDSSGTALYTVENVPLYIQSDDSIGSTVTAEPYLSTGLANDLEQIKGAISVNPSEPSISLGTEGANLKLTNDRLSFQQSSSDGSELVEVAYISSEEDLGTININNAKINSSLVIGELELCEVNGGIAVRRAM